ncbi:MAG: hypothetical protein BCS36_03025 [Desulfovibrio sp. MES5]|uniref:hypothetical protein n=1 Tax=Desulfovibrio sp. MES5 TaxID=1899016 RepID=UPI000B9CDB81|nr:hypothetical protein [Desulfovibrio sp. MES5]OXS29235.1 MAG: hypothetical protein BCS36_03025 [Desulfovibrio sp. MES5]
MAIAGIVVSSLREHLLPLCSELRATRGVLDVQEVPEADKLAVVLESPSQTLQGYLEYVSGLPYVLALDVAFINYEDDMDSTGHMPCPPHRPKGHGPSLVVEGVGEGGLQ